MLRTIIHRLKSADALELRIPDVPPGAPLRCLFCHLALRTRKPLPAAHPKNLETLGDHLRKKRLDVGLLQREVAERLGVTKDTIHNWESNHRSPQLSLVPKIIDFLGYVPLQAPPNTLGERIVARRRLLGLTQKELARRLEVDPTTLGRWERGEGKAFQGTHRTAGYLPQFCPPDDRTVNHGPDQRRTASTDIGTVPRRFV